MAALVASGAFACSRSPFEEEAHGAVPAPRKEQAVADAGVLPSAGTLPYATMGRTTPTSEGRRFDWPGSGLRVRFRGDALRVVLDQRGSDDLAVVIDAAEPTVHASRAGQHALRLPVAPGEHVVRIAKRTEARSGHFFVTAIDAEHGELLPVAERRRIEFLGDSISAGFGIEPALASGACAFVPREQNALGTYAVQFASARDEDAAILAVSSQTTREMTHLFERAWPSERAPLWTFGEAPTAVVLLLGTNDFFHRDPGKATFVYDYRALLGRVRAHYGSDVPVVATLSPMLSDAYPAGGLHRTRGRKYLQAALKSARAAGDQRLFSLEFDEPTPEEGTGCSSHPSAATHARMADTLARFFAQEHL